ncbi:MAG: hypoxanthine phosphoribosyltransferase [Clostridiales bacterium]|nr:hypoxanthine phosphoribosyltransferase [Clostridia bacterium]MCR4564265.1 hypoxanthine phosphoribosyltransferase [Clostridiales bacterium]
MKEDIQEILLSEEQIKETVEKLGRQISEDYRDKNLVLVSVLKGSVVFMADLMRNVTIPCEIDFMAVSSYGKGTKTSGNVKIIKDLDRSVEGMDLLIVEDILDSGRTLSYLREMLKQRNANSIKICTLLDKPERREADIKADYFGAVIPDAFAVGYGLDYAEKYRNLPYIGILKPSVYE